MLYHQPKLESRLDEIVPLSSPLGASGLPTFDGKANERLQGRTPMGGTPLTGIGAALNGTGITQGLLATPSRPFNEFIE